MPPGVGWGFVARAPRLLPTCARIGVTFIGPRAEAMRRLGDKIGNKLIAGRSACRSPRGVAAGWDTL